MTYAELFAGVSEIVTRIIEAAGKDPGRWLDLVSHVDTLPADDRDRLLAAFETLEPDSLGEPGRQEVWRALVDLGTTHRQFPNADWAMPGDVVDRVEATAAHFAPTSPVDLSVDLFDHRPRLPDVDPLTLDEYEAALLRARQDAARAVLDTEGIPGSSASVSLPSSLSPSVGRRPRPAATISPTTCSRSSGRTARRAGSRRVTPEDASRLTAWTGLSGSSSAGPMASQSSSRPGSSSRSRGRTRHSSRSWAAFTPMCRRRSGGASTRSWSTPMPGPSWRASSWSTGAPGVRSTSS